MAKVGQVEGSGKAVKRMSSFIACLAFGVGKTITCKARAHRIRIFLLEPCPPKNQVFFRGKIPPKSTNIAFETPRQRKVNPSNAGNLEKLFQSWERVAQAGTHIMTQRQAWSRVGLGYLDDFDNDGVAQDLDTKEAVRGATKVRARVEGTRGSKGWNKTCNWPQGPRAYFFGITSATSNALVFLNAAFKAILAAKIETRWVGRRRMHVAAISDGDCNIGFQGELR